MSRAVQEHLAELQDGAKSVAVATSLMLISLAVRPVSDPESKEHLRQFLALAQKTLNVMTEIVAECSAELDKTEQETKQ